MNLRILIISAFVGSSFGQLVNVTEALQNAASSINNRTTTIASLLPSNTRLSPSVNKTTSSTIPTESEIRLIPMDMPPIDNDLNDVSDVVVETTPTTTVVTKMEVKSSASSSSTNGAPEETEVVGDYTPVDPATDSSSDNNASTGPFSITSKDTGMYFASSAEKSVVSFSGLAMFLFLQLIQ